MHARRDGRFGNWLQSDMVDSHLAVCAYCHVALRIFTRSRLPGEKYGLSSRADDDYMSYNFQHT